MLLILTGVSTSWKTTLQKELMTRWWKSAINFTTREPRSEKERDEYVFIDKPTFMTKLINWDFIEHTDYNGEYYGASRFLPKGNVVMVLDPVGRAQVMSEYARKDLSLNTAYLSISKDTQMKRLEERHMSVRDIEARHKDYQWFHKTKFCLELDGEMEVGRAADIVEANMKT